MSEPGSRRYQIQQPIGQGGFGTVYLGRLVGEGGFHKDVAIKILKEGVADNPEIEIRLRDEARLLGLLSHRAILKVDALVRIEGRWAVVMEYAPGVNLKEALGKGVMSTGPAVELVGEVASALAVAWEQEGPDGRPLRLIHRDIKPSNIQLTASGEVKVLDFGIARAEFEEREAETQSMFMGSLGYMAPERLDRVDGPQGDIYALGVTLYELLAGRRFGKTSLRREAHEEGLAGAMDQLRGELDDGHGPVVDLLAAMLAFEPDQRPTGRELVRRCRDLRQRIDDEWLAEWAAGAVPEAAARRKPLRDDEFGGATLVEGGSAGEFHRSATGDDNEDDDRWTETKLVRVASLSAGAVGVGMVGVGALLAVAALILIFAVVRPSDSAETPAVVSAAAPLETGRRLEEAPAPPVEVAPTGREVEQPEEIPEPAPLAVAARAPAAPPRPLPSAPVVEERPAPPPPEAPGGQVRFAGDAERVRLASAAGSFEAGRVPAGRYRIHVTFPGESEVPAGEIEVLDGSSVVVTCQAAFARCR